MTYYKWKPFHKTFVSEIDCSLTTNRMQWFVWNWSISITHDPHVSIEKQKRMRHLRYSKYTPYLSIWSSKFICCCSSKRVPCGCVRRGDSSNFTASLLPGTFRSGALLLGTCFTSSGSASSVLSALSDISACLSHSASYADKRESLERPLSNSASSSCFWSPVSSQAILHSLLHILWTNS